VAKVLYITYDGLTDPLGRSQVLPYLQGCAARGHHITVLSCEKSDRFLASGRTVEELCRKSGIDWRPRRYHKSPPIISTIYDARGLTRAAARLHREHNFDLVHCRSYISAIAGLKLKRSQGVPLLFDMRGFWPEEKTEGGAWDLRNPLYRAVYRYFKRLESDLLRESDHIISLTEAGKSQLLSRPECAGQPDRISVIPCCVDFHHFQLAAQSCAAARARLGIEPDVPVLTYLGSLGGNYMLDQMLDFFSVYRGRHPTARFLFVTFENPESIRKAALDCGVDPTSLIIRAAAREEVPSTIAASDIGIAFKQPSFSALATSPTKIGEMLAMGISVVANGGVGDVEEVITSLAAGAVVRSFDESGYAAAIEQIGSLSASPAAIRQGALGVFNLERAVSTYDSVYREIALPVPMSVTRKRRAA
jgi:glycosyltransferase involved in cell wall biosynthesis